ncbi:MAG: hypothetical protein RR253_01535 [Oscillospiraceae bacterium]
MKNLLKKGLALTLCMGMIFSMNIGASAAEPRVSNFGSLAGKKVRVVSYAHPAQELNVLTAKDITNNKNVTTWPSSQADIFHNFFVIDEGNSKFSFRCEQTSTFAVEYYYGSSNMHNCDVYYTLAGPAYILPEDYQFTPSSLAYFYKFHVAKNNYALTTAENMTVTGQSIKNVRWAPGNVSDDNQGWTITVIA